MHSEAPQKPIAGITPIEEMTREAAPGTAARPAAARLRVELPLTPETMLAAFRRALNWNRPFADRPQDAQSSA